MTEVFDGLMKNIVPRMMNGHWWTVRSTWDKPIPDAQNIALSECLKLIPDYVWSIEEDTVPPIGILSAMIQMNAPVVVADYKMDDGSLACHRNKAGAVIYGGIGCALIRRRALEHLHFPLFELGHWQLQADGSFSSHAKHTKPKYGSQDVSFFVKLQQAGVEVKYAGDSWKCKHLRLDGLGERGVNNGLHKIRVL
jgi:hypothetical protein